MQVGIPKETFPGERRVALVPADVAKLAKAGMGVTIEPGAGLAAGFSDKAYGEKGAKLAFNRAGAFEAEIVAQVRSLGANLKAGRTDLPLLRQGQVLLGLADPLGEPAAVAEIAKTGVSFFALELIPRTTRAQAMDVLSSQATIAGYRAVILAAIELPKIFPLLMTAAGTLTATKAFVIGIGVAGLQAIATAKRLGAVVRGYDLRPACREQVESLGGKFVEIPLEAAAEGKGGYAAAQDEAFYRRQRELLSQVVSESDLVITTAAIPGKKSPTLVTAEAVSRMQPGSVIVDLAAERGGNCELTKADQRVVTDGGVTILGPTNLPSEVPTHASQMFSGNVTNFLLNLVKKGQIVMNKDDEIIRETLTTEGGQVVNGRIRELLGLAKLPEPASIET
jgi:NAD(P) transhydrogenase subunit alpha